LLDRLNSPARYDPVETIALIEYRLRFARAYFEGADPRISKALGAFFLMREELILPEYVEWDQWKREDKRLPTPGDPQRDIDELLRGIDELRGDSLFQAWVDAVRAQFRRPRQRAPLVPRSTENPWAIKEDRTADHATTVYDPNNVTRTADEIDDIREATKGWAEDIVVFQPERMALHETIAASVSRIQMENPTRFLKDVILCDGGLFTVVILPKIEPLKASFELDRVTFEQYVESVMDDHFYMLNPDMEIREVLRKRRKAIEKRIADSKDDEKRRYDPDLVKTPRVLKHLVADDLLRAHYKAKVREIVDEAITTYLTEYPERALPLKPNRGRIALRWTPEAGQLGMLY
jgi:hypothetical protein